MKNQPFHRRLGFALHGIAFAWRNETSFRTQCAATVGVLTPRRAELVSGASLARWAERLALGECLRLGRGEAQTGGHAKESVLATALEAVLGAVYREAGLPGAARVIAALALW